MSDIRPGHWRAIFRKNTPSETRANWAYIREAGARIVRAILIALILALITLSLCIAYAMGYFEGGQAAMRETISKEGIEHEAQS